MNKTHPLPRHYLEVVVVLVEVEAEEVVVEEEVVVVVVIVMVMLAMIAIVVVVVVPYSEVVLMPSVHASNACDGTPNLLRLAATMRTDIRSPNDTRASLVRGVNSPINFIPKIMMMMTMMTIAEVMMMMMMMMMTF